MSKSEWNRLGKRPDSGFYCYSVELMDVDDRYDILYSQKYFVAT